MKELLKSDLDLIKEWQDINTLPKIKTQLESDLYRKYTPLCKSISRRYQHTAPFEDNMQECYLIMIKALKYVDEDKINNVEGYSFGITFKQYLRSYFNVQNYESEEKIIRDKNLSLEEDIPNFEGVTLRNNTYESEIIFDIALKQFRETLDEEESFIFNSLEKGEEKQTLNLKSIYYKINKIKNKYINFMNINGYAIN